MSSAYQKDRAYSDQFYEATRRSVGPHLLIPASFKQDLKEATDFANGLALYSSLDKKIAARVRTPKYAENAEYIWQFTLRSLRESGAMTELEKIQRGFGQWLLYGFAANNGLFEFQRWMLVDLDAFRYHWAQTGWGNINTGLRWGQKSNGDGTHFHWFDINSFPANPPILIDASFDWPVTKPETMNPPDYDQEWDDLFMGRVNGNHASQGCKLTKTKASK